MSKKLKQTHDIAFPDGDPESKRLLAIEDIARQIAVLVVRQHRRLSTQDGKKDGENAL